jgi:LysM repeat protein
LPLTDTTIGTQNQELQNWYSIFQKYFSRHAQNKVLDKCQRFNLYLRHNKLGVHPMTATTLHTDQPTRQRRTLALLLIAGTCIALASAFFAPQGPQTFETVTVRSGDTLWAIAERANPNVDPRDTIDSIIKKNNLTTSTVEPGQQILVPKS